MPFAMTSGSRGYHVVAPLLRRQDGAAVRTFAGGLADLLVARRAGPLHGRDAQGEARRADPRRRDAQPLRAHRGRAVLGPRPPRRAGRDAAAARGARRPGDDAAAPHAADHARRAWPTTGIPGPRSTEAARALAAAQRRLDALLEEVGAR